MTIQKATGGKNLDFDLRKVAIRVMTKCVCTLVKTVARQQGSLAYRWVSLRTEDRQTHISGDGDFMVEREARPGAVHKSLKRQSPVSSC